MPSLNRSGKNQGNHPVLLPNPSGSVEHSLVEAVVCQHLLGLELGQCVFVSFHLLQRGAVPSSEHTLLPRCQTQRCGLFFWGEEEPGGSREGAEG